MRRLLFLLAAFSLFAQDKKPPEKLAPYLPTPLTIVDRMLKLADLKPKEEMWDLGSGDGRIVIMAAEKFGAEAIGVEFDYDLFHSSQAKIRNLELQNARIILRDPVLLHEPLSLRGRQFRHLALHLGDQ